MSKYVPASQINDQVTWQDISPGGDIRESGNATLVNTGNWRTMIPTYVESKCKQCMLCVPVCPDVSIPVKDGKRLNFDYEHCKGCGICYKVCPFGAITFAKEEK
ncbi:MAG: 4Fe-4S binding protein [Synergistaceae bacterium]|nr:4Fe-4S binding protein [Synergistaceae bacterium]